MKRNDDNELVALARLGSREAFGSLIERHRDGVLSFVRRIAVDEPTAWDLMQEATLQAWLSLASLRSGDAFRPWLCGIALNLCRSRFRKGSGRHVSYESLVEGGYERGETAPDPQELLELRERRERVRRAVDALSPANSDVVLLYYYDRLSVDEIARGLGLSVAAVKGRLFKARRQLRRMLAPLYRESSRDILTNQRRHPMVPVIISDLIKSTVDENFPIDAYTIVLLDEEGSRALPIHVGHAEGESIAWNLLDLSPPRPLTFSFVAGILETAGAELKDVRVESLRENIYYASVRLSIHGSERTLDARPSDAIALATRLGAPVYVASELMDASAVPVVADPDGGSHRGWGLARIREELERMMRLGFGDVPPGRGERLARALVEFAFRTGPEMASGEAVGPTESFRETLRLAREEAVRLRHVMIDVDDLLLGMLVEGRGNAVNILIRLGCDPVDLHAAIEADADRVRDDAVFATVTGLPMDAGRNVLLTEAAESIMKAAAGMPGRPGESPVREEIESTVDLPEAVPNRRSMPVDYRGRRPATDDLLSAMLSDGENAAARALAERGITYERVRREIEAMRS